MILFRVDGNKEIGTGHVMRCLSIAQALREQGEAVCFLLADDFMKDQIEAKGFHTKVLHTNYADMDEELHILLPYLSSQRGVLVVDSYFVTKQYLESLQKVACVAYIDDLFEMPIAVDYMINYNIYGPSLAYKKQNLAKQEYWLGCEYVPLRDEFSKRAFCVRKTCKKVLITTGGADKFNIAGQALKEFIQQEHESEIFRGLEFHVVVGMFHQHRAMLESLAQEHDNIKLHANVTQMSLLMEECDIAISAAGSTMYELFAVGVPTISFSFVDNQRRMIDTLQKTDAIICAGHYQLTPQETIRSIVDAVELLCGDYAKRLELHTICHELVDGKGAQRLAERLRKAKDSVIDEER